MAHFAELDPNNVVIRVLVVDNQDITDHSGQEQEAQGVSLLQSLFGAETSWVQTSYNANFRYRYAGIGMIYDPVRDAFAHPQPYPSWTYDEATHSWIPPVAMPSDGAAYSWDEGSDTWIAVNQGA